MSIAKIVTLGTKTARLISKGPWQEYQDRVLTHRMQVDVEIDQDRFLISFTINGDQDALELQNEAYDQGCCNQHQIELTTLKTELLKFAWDFL